MKNLLKILSLTVALCLVAMTVMACGGAKPSGTYVFESLKISGESWDEADASTKTLMETMIKGAYTNMEITFKGDEATMKVTVADKEQTETNKFKMDGKKVIMLNEDGEPEEDANITVDGKKLIISASEEGLDIEVTFKKK